jgi:hypothetical protein
MSTPHIVQRSVLCLLLRKLPAMAGSLRNNKHNANGYFLHDICFVGILR